MLSDQEMLERMANGWRMGRPFTDCGNGSTLANTKNAREWLPKITQRYDISTVNDAGCGDMAWIEHMSWSVEYLPFDLIPRREGVLKIDITREELPRCDAILCRMVLNHLDEARILMALTRFRASASYLIATQFNGENLPKRSPQFTRLDLRSAPYDLGEPLEFIQDGAEPNCHLALWMFE